MRVMGIFVRKWGPLNLTEGISNRESVSLFEWDPLALFRQLLKTSKFFFFS